LTFDEPWNFFNPKETIKKYSIDNTQFSFYDNAIFSEIGEETFLIS